MTRQRAKRVVIIGALAAPLALIVTVYIWSVERSDQQRKDALAALGRPAAESLYADLKTAQKSPSSKLLSKTYDLTDVRFSLQEALDHILETEKILDGLRAQLIQDYGEAFPNLEIVPVTMAEEDYIALETSLIPYRGIYEKAIAHSRISGPAYAVDFGESINPEMSHFESIQMLIRILLRFAVLQAHHGNFDEASESIVAAIRIANKLTLELATNTHRHHSYVLIMKLVHHVFPETGLSESARVAIMELPDLQQYRRAYADAIRMFAIQTSKRLDAVRRHEKNAVFNLVPEENLSLPYRLYFSSFGRAVMNRDEFHMHTMIRESLQTFESEAFRQKAFQQSIEERTEHLPAQYLLSSTIPGLLIEIFPLQLKMEAQIRLLKIGLAVEAHADAYGALPESLEEVATTHGLNTTDPFTGESLLYKVEDDGFLLYSVGDNEVDDGGQHNPRWGDIVWRGVIVDRPRPVPSN